MNKSDSFFIESNHSCFFTASLKVRGLVTFNAYEQVSYIPFSDLTLSVGDSSDEDESSSLVVLDVRPVPTTFVGIGQQLFDGVVALLEDIMSDEP